MGTARGKFITNRRTGLVLLLGMVLAGIVGAILGVMVGATVPEEPVVIEGLLLGGLVGAGGVLVIYSYLRYVA